MMVTIWLMMVNNIYGAWGKKTSSKPPSRIGFDPSSQRKCWEFPRAPGSSGHVEGAEVSVHSQTIQAES